MGWDLTVIKRDGDRRSLIGFCPSPMTKKGADRYPGYYLLVLSL